MYVKMPEPEPDCRCVRGPNPSNAHSDHVNPPFLYPTAQTSMAQGAWKLLFMFFFLVQQNNVISCETERGNMQSALLFTPHTFDLLTRKPKAACGGVLVTGIHEQHRWRNTCNYSTSVHVLRLSDSTVGQCCHRYTQATLCPRWRTEQLGSMPPASSYEVGFHVGCASQPAKPLALAATSLCWKDKTAYRIYRNFSTPPPNFLQPYAF